MNPETEKKLLALAGEIKELDKAIAKERAETGVERPELRKRFFEVEEEIKRILAEEGPLDEIRDPIARDILRKVRNGNFYLIDKEISRTRKLLQKLPPEVLDDFLKEKGIDVTEEEVDEEIDRISLEFIEEIFKKIDGFDYFKRKKEIGTIIADTKLPKRIYDYFLEIRECFLLGLMYPAVGLCRVLLELAFKDRFRASGLGKKYTARNVYPMDAYRMKDIIRDVCKRLGSESLKDESERIWGMSSDILHGREAKIKLETSEVLEFIKRTFDTLEKLYRS